jgi:riboflavin-specific deaminase-like protein
MFAPSDVITVWVALDDMDEEEIGPLQYVKGSHRWSDGRIGSANQFFDSQGGMDLLESAAARSGESTVAFESMAGLLAGGISVHDGRTWHGSGPNQSRSRPRRGLGLHFVPANVRFTAEAAKSTLWKRYLGDGSVDPAEVALPEEDFPIVWMPSSFPKKRARAMRIAIPSLLFLLFIMIETTLAWAPHIRQQACVVGASRRQLRICRATIAVSSTASSSSHLTNENSHDQGITTGVTLKIAVDSQGGLADLAAQTSDRFTAPSSLDMVHRLRADSQAVLIGRQTVVFDDPSLTVRRNVALVGSPPLRVVLDTRLSLLIDRALQGKNYQLFEDGLPTVVYHSVTDADEESLALPEWVDLVQLPPASEENSWVRVQDVWRDLQERYGVCHLMVEGGWATARAFLRAGLVDRLVLVRAPGVTFRDPVPSGITAESLGQEFQLERLGTVASEGDVMECWVRPGESWPTTDLSAWP